MSVRYVVYTAVGAPCFGGKRFRTVEKAVRYAQRKLPLGLMTFLSYHVKEIVK